MEGHVALDKHTNPIASAKAATMQDSNMLIVLLLDINHMIGMTYIHWSEMKANIVGVRLWLFLQQRKPANLTNPLTCRLFQACTIGELCELARLQVASNVTWAKIEIWVSLRPFKIKKNAFDGTKTALWPWLPPGHARKKYT